VQPIVSNCESRRRSAHHYYQSLNRLLSDRWSDCSSLSSRRPEMLRCWDWDQLPGECCCCWCCGAFTITSSVQSSSVQSHHTLSGCVWRHALWGSLLQHAEWAENSDTFLSGQNIKSLKRPPSVTLFDVIYGPTFINFVTLLSCIIQKKRIVFSSSIGSSTRACATINRLSLKLSKFCTND